MLHIVAAVYTSQDYLFFLSNMLLIAGYLAFGLTFLLMPKILPHLSAIYSRRTRLFAAGFWFSCFVTSAQLGYHTIIQESLLNAENNKSVPWDVIFLYGFKGIALLGFGLSLVSDLNSFFDEFRKPDDE